MAGHKDNHGGLMTPTQMDEFKQQMGVADGKEWEKFSLVKDQKSTQKFLDQVPFFAKGTRRFEAAQVEVGTPVELADREIASQAGFGKILDEIAKNNPTLSERIVTTSPDVTVTTNLTGWVNRKGLFARNALHDEFKDQRIPSAQKWAFSPDGQHIELGIAEMNLFLLLGAAGPVSLDLW